MSFLVMEKNSIPIQSVTVIPNHQKFEKKKIRLGSFNIVMLIRPVDLANKLI